MHGLAEGRPWTSLRRSSVSWPCGGFGGFASASLDGYWGWPCISVRRGFFGFVAEAWIPEGWTLHRLPAELLRLALNRLVGRFVRFKVSPGLVTVRGFRATEAREMAVCLAAELRERLDAPKSPPAAAPDPAPFVAVDVTPPSWQQARPPGQQ